jgi:hypothetical protein
MTPVYTGFYVLYVQQRPLCVTIYGPFLASTHSHVVTKSYTKNISALRELTRLR